MPNLWPLSVATCLENAGKGGASSAALFVRLLARRGPAVDVGVVAREPVRCRLAGPWVVSGVALCFRMPVWLVVERGVVARPRVPVVGTDPARGG